MRTGTALGAVFAVAGLWSARRFAAGNRLRATAWAAWGVAVPLVVLFSHWFAFGNLDRDLGHAAVALVLAVGFALAGEVIARAEEPPLTGRSAVSFVLAGAGIALLLGLQMGFSAGWTTILLGAALALPAFATRYRSYAVLGWLSAAGALAVLLRFAIDPTVVGSYALSQTPVFNWLLPGYGVPALGAAFAALAARPHHRRPAAADHGGGGLVLRADRRCHAGPSRDAWRCHRYGGADACRTVDLYADRARRQRHPDRAGRPLAEPGLPHRFDGDRRWFRWRWW